jgi:ubiquinone/menaquinone biosynthesis C-methylase UbiE
MPARLDVPGRERGPAIRRHVSAESASDAQRNRAAWTEFAPQYAEWAPKHWARTEITWGIWHAPEKELQILGDVDGLDVVDLGCGTGFFSAWLARRGARPVGVDVTPAQLATARAMMAQFGPRFPLIEASAERVPLPDASFDLALSEYGAAIWCDPYRWIPEAARLLRPGGRLAFLATTPILMMVEPMFGQAGRELLRDYFGMHRFDWPDDHSVEFQLPYGEWIRLFRANGLEVERLVELRAPADSPIPFDHLTSEWANRWPAEHIWVTRKAASAP